MEFIKAVKSQGSIRLLGAGGMKLCNELWMNSDEKNELLEAVAKNVNCDVNENALRKSPEKKSKIRAFGEKNGKEKVKAQSLKLEPEDSQTEMLRKII